MTPDLDAIAKLRKAAHAGYWEATSEPDAEFIAASFSFDFDALQSRLAVLEGALLKAEQSRDRWKALARRYFIEGTPDPDSEERTPATFPPITTRGGIVR